MTPKTARRHYELTLPYPPTVNLYYINGRILTANARKYRLAVQGAIYDLLGKTAKPLEGDLTMDIVVAHPDRIKRDLDNLLKGLLDAMQHAKIYRDDNQIVDFRISKHEKAVKGGEVRVNVFEQTKS